jgi:hypothetical protein
MHPNICGLIALSLAQFLINPVHAQADPGLQAITDLSQLNGQALACQEFKVATRAKYLMLQHSPKTARYGGVFDEGTHQAFVAQTRSPTPCPHANTLFAQLEVLALKLQTSLPAAVPTTGVQ